MAKRQTTPDLLTVEEACALLGCGAMALRYYMEIRKLSRMRSSGGELRLAQAEVEQLAMKIPRG